MPRKTILGGTLIAAAALSIPCFGIDDPVTPVPTRSFDIEYAVDETALPLDSVRLWYTRDGGESWRDHGYDEDRQSPFVFDAPEEGLYGFYLTLVNAAGPSGLPPTPSTRPHQWAFVDYTPPVVQLHPARSTTALGQRVLQIRWTAVDAHFDTRPIEIAIRRPSGDTWQAIAGGPFANTGRLDWRIPDALTGTLSLRVTATDQGGHRARSEPVSVDIASTPQVVEQSSAAPAGPNRGDGGPTRPPVLSGSKRAKERASHLLAEAVDLGKQGAFREGISRLREAVTLNPNATDAFAEMASLLYRNGDLDRALNAYDIALQQQPRMRKALQGSAMVYNRMRDYRSAAERLRTILRYNPNDVEIWLNLGDVAVYQGDEVLARECYLRASQMDSQATRIIEQAGQRLELMARSSRTPQRSKP